MILVFRVVLMEWFGYFVNKVVVCVVNLIFCNCFVLILVLNCFLGVFVFVICVCMFWIFCVIVCVFEGCVKRLIWKFLIFCCRLGFLVIGWVCVRVRCFYVQVCFCWYVLNDWIEVVIGFCVLEGLRCMFIL